MIAPRQAGIAIPLFSLRSTDGWGIGEIGDIPQLARWLSAAGQSVLQILPLNELAPDEASPYSALSAMAIDPQFVSIRLIEDAEAELDAYRDGLEIVRRSARVEYRPVRALKHRALGDCFENFCRRHWNVNTARADALRSYIAREDWWLHDYSLYRAIRSRHGEQPWPQWPAALRHRDPAAMREATSAFARDILFFQYVQWIADDQWQTTRREARGIEILGDFPFMVTLDSADVWSRQQEFLLDAQIGTPPDAFSETGQEWGLPPYNWPIIRENNFEWLRRRARRMSQLYDGFRIDHLVGFYRTYVRPYDASLPYFSPELEPDQIDLGEAIVRIMMETGADVSAEDLGTVPDFVRESIARLGVPGYKVLRWEPLLPPMYPPVSVAMTGTHDTEPLAVWWESLLPDEQRRFGIEGIEFDNATRDALLKMMFDAGSRLLLLPIQDVFGWRERINLPATLSDDNWTWTLPWPVERLIVEADAQERAKQLAEWAASSGRTGARGG